MTERRLSIAMTAAVALVLARAAVFLFWEQASFDSDQAIFGLMAKHIVEGRAFPMFIYGEQYLLAVEAWLAAPLFALFGPAPAALKLTVVLVNIATAMLLVWVLHRDGGLKPITALIASLFYTWAAPALAGALVSTAGGNPEPFLYVLLLWVLRHRPLAFGVVFGIGFTHREFTAYGMTAIVALALVDNWRVTTERLRATALAGIGYLAVWQLVRTGFVFSDPFGPGSPITTTLGGGTNIEGLAGRYCWAPETIVPGLASMFGDYAGIVFGADNHRLAEVGVRSLVRTNVTGLPAFWPLLAAVFAIATARVVWITTRDRIPLWRGHGAVGAFLLLVGLQAGAAYSVARCGHLDPTTLRYALLTLYLGVGVVALFFIYEPHRRWRRLMVGVMLAWALATASAHARLLNEYVFHEPQNPARQLATYLVGHGIRYARADYWTAYATTFLAREQVVIASTEVVRINGYQREVDAHRTEAVTVQREPCRDAAGPEAVPGTYWICPE